MGEGDCLPVPDSYAREFNASLGLTGCACVELFLMRLDAEILRFPCGRILH